MSLVRESVCLRQSSVSNERKPTIMNHYKHQENPFISILCVLSCVVLDRWSAIANPSTPVRFRPEPPYNKVLKLVALPLLPARGHWCGSALTLQQ